MSELKRKDTRKGDRHRPGYWVEYGRKRRAREKLERAAIKANTPIPKPNTTEQKVKTDDANR